MNAYEEAVSLDCQGDKLFGVLSLPTTVRETGVLIVVGGPQYRIGSHRQFVLLARCLASEGYATLRFDSRGMGDSGGALRDFEHLTDDIRAALDCLTTHAMGVQRVVIWGLCDGASASLLYLHQTRDPRVAGLVMVNPWVRSVQSHARTQVKHYYLERLRTRAFWVKLLSGRVAANAVAGLVSSLRAARRAPSAGPVESYQQRMALAWAAFDGSILLLLSERDYTAREFVEFTSSDTHWREALTRSKHEEHTLANADHTLSGNPERRQMESTVLEWLGRIFAPAAEQRPSSLETKHAKPS